MVVEAAAVDVGRVAYDLGALGEDGAVFEVDAAAASGRRHFRAVGATGLVFFHVGVQQSDGVACGRRVGAFAEDAAAVAKGGGVVAQGGVTDVDAPRVVVDATAVVASNVVV